MPSFVRGVVLIVWLGGGVQAQGPAAGAASLGQAVAERARAVHVDVTMSARATRVGGTVTFFQLIRAELPTSAKGLAAGALVGTLDVASGMANVPAGHYHVFVSHPRTGWEGVLEHDGKIVATTNDVIVDEFPPGTRRAAPPPDLKVSNTIAIVLGGAAWGLHLVFGTTP